MSDDKWDTTDASSTKMKLFTDRSDDALTETESLPAESDEKCPYCHVYKVMADSRL